MKLQTRDLIIGTAVALTMVLAACSSKNSDDDSGTGSTSGVQGGSPSSSLGGAGNDATGGRVTGGRAATGGSPTATGGDTSFYSQMVKACPGFPVTDSTTDDGGVCRGVGEELEASPLDLMIAMDRTTSMTYCMDGRHDACGKINNSSEPSRWEVLQQGLQQFLTDMSAMPVTRRPRMGLRFFGDAGIEPDDCNASIFASPQVPMQDFASASTAIVSAMDQMAPYLGGQTPWQPSLQGVLQYAQDWQKNHMDRVTVVLFVTDGFPTICDRDMNHILSTIGEYYWGVQGDYNSVGKPGVRTYILGVGGEFNSANRYNLDSAAAAGGTNEATIANNPGDVTTLAESLQNVSNAKVDCDFALPPPPAGQMLDVDKVQVIYEPFTGAKQEIPKGSCSGTNGGWEFDTAVPPTKVIVCPCSCANLGAGRINVTFGCTPKRSVG